MNSTLQSDIVSTWEAWLKSSDAPRRVTQATINIYLHHLKAFREWLRTTLDVDLSPEAVTAYRLESYVTYVQHQLQRAPATQTVIVAALRLFATWLQQVGYCVDHPARRLRAQAEQPAVPRALDERIVRRILDAAHQPGVPLRDTLIIELLAVSGMRSSEIAQIRVEDIHQGKRTTWLKVHGKGNKIRQIALPKRVGTVIEDYLAESKALVLGLAGAFEQKPTVWCP